MVDVLLDLLTYVGGFLFMAAIFAVRRVARHPARPRMAGGRAIPRSELRSPRRCAP